MKEKKNGEKQEKWKNRKGNWEEKWRRGIDENGDWKEKDEDRREREESERERERENVWDRLAKAMGNGPEGRKFD